MGYTAFPVGEKRIKERIEVIDKNIFKEESLGDCRALYRRCSGLCCSFFVGLNHDEADILTDLVKVKRDEFRRINLFVPEPITVYDSKNDRSVLLKRPRTFTELRTIIPLILRNSKEKIFREFKVLRKFSYTCVFSMHEGSCGLQALAVSENRHSWYYKPLNCWKYPLRITKENVLSLYPKGPVYSFFPCSRECEDGKPAYETLMEELSFMGKIVGRDIITEIQAD